MCIPAPVPCLPVTDDILLLKQRLAEQEALIHALQEKLSNREREIDHLQAQLDKLRRLNFGSRSEKVSRRIAQMEADLNRLQQESDTLTGRVDDPVVQRSLRQTLTRKPFPESCRQWLVRSRYIAENALRMVSLGRKNWLFFGSDYGGERGVLLYSLIGTCKLNGMEPESYLRHVLDVIADWPVNWVGELLPWRITLPTE